MTRYIFILLFILGIISCNTSKKVVSEETVEDQAEMIETPQETSQPGPSQRQRGGFQNPDNNPEYLAMVDSIGMNEEQKMQFEFINKAYREKVQKKRQEARDSGSGMQGMREEMMKMRADQEGAIKNLLTEKQFIIYSDFMEKRREERESRRGQRGF